MKHITSIHHPIVKHFVKLRESKSYRYDHRCVMIEGRKMIGEICINHPATILAVEESRLIPESVNASETVVVSNAVMKKISGTNTPEGYVAEVPMPNMGKFMKIDRLLVLDGINDPGNMGTLLRSALAFGWDGAFLISGSCDPFNDKALRSGKGATFRLPLEVGTWERLQEIIRERHLTSYLADLEGDDVGNLLFPASEPLLLVMGNEAHGPSPEARSLCRKIKIPMIGEMESLNVATAAGIMMYVMGKEHKLR